MTYKKKNPSILKQAIHCDNSQYNKVLLQVCGIFSTSSIKYFLGFEKATISKSDQVHFQWYNTRLQNFNRIFKISSGIQFYKANLHSLYDNIFTFHDLANNLFVNWNEIAIQRKKAEFLRKVFIS